MSDFWSRRKQAVEEAQAAEEKARAAQDESEEQAEREAVQAEMTEAELLESLNLPDPDLAKSGDDIAAFMAKAVPRHIRNRALRSLWRSNPVLACIDGLNDYDGDFTGNGLNGGVLKTSYQVGKGLTAHIEKMAQDARKAEGTEEEAAATPIPDGKNRELPIDAATQNPLAPPPSSVESMPVDTEAEELSDHLVTPPRRMRFTFEEDDQE